MTQVIDEDLHKWIDNDIPIDETEFRLKEGAPD
jgi:hypothetical protein